MACRAQTHPLTKVLPAIGMLTTHFVSQHVSRRVDASSAAAAKDLRFPLRQRPAHHISKVTLRSTPIMQL